MKHFILFYYILAGICGFSTLVTSYLFYYKTNEKLAKQIFLLLLSLNFQLCFSTILHYRHINLLSPITSLHVVFTIMYFLAEASVIYSGSILCINIIEIPPAKLFCNIFKFLFIFSIAIIISPFFIHYDPGQSQITALFGFVIYRVIFLGGAGVLLVMLLKNLIKIQDKWLKNFLIGSFVFSIILVIEILFCKLMPIIKFPAPEIRFSPLIFIVCSINLFAYLFNHYFNINNIIFENHNEQLNGQSSEQLYEQPSAFCNLITSREKEIIKLLVEGFTYREISEKLYIAESTVKTHVLKIYKKLGVKNKVQIINIINNSKAS